MTTKHTPGPWRIKFGPQHSPEHCDITIAGDIFLLADIGGPNYPHCEANARLMEASPEMLEMLKEAADFVQPFNHAADFLDRIEALIAKAEGGTP